MGMPTNSSNPGGQPQPNPFIGKPYGIMPQGPYQARPDLGPGVGFGAGLPQPGGSPLSGSFINGTYTPEMPNSFDDSAIRQNAPIYNGGINGIAGLFGNTQPQSQTPQNPQMGFGMPPSGGYGGGKGGLNGDAFIGAPMNSYDANGNIILGGIQGSGPQPGQTPQGPYTPRPDLGPGVGFGVNSPQPAPYLADPMREFNRKMMEGLKQDPGMQEYLKKDPISFIGNTIVGPNGNTLTWTGNGWSETPPQGPFTPRPDLGPGVGFGPGLPKPTTPPPPTRTQPNPFIGKPMAPIQTRPGAVSITNRANPRTVTPQPITRTRTRR